MEYIFKGTVEKGNQIGRKMNIPTVNIPVTDENLPEFGVYTAMVTIEGSRRILYGVANLGVKPTIDSENGVNPPGVEVYLFDFSEELYGSSISVCLKDFIRKERKFSDLSQLKSQIEADIETAKEKLSYNYRSEKAMNYFLDGYTCAQSVALAFLDQLDIDKDILLRISSGFGGGMGRLREVCGSVSGMFMVTNLLYGFTLPENAKEKGELYQRIQTLAAEFEAQNGSIVCRELLGLKGKKDDPLPCERSTEYYKKRPCKELIGCAARILDDYIKDSR